MNSNIPISPAYGILSHNSSDTQGLAPLRNIFWEWYNFAISRAMSRNVRNRLYGSSIVGTGIKQYETPIPIVTRHSGGWPYIVTPFINQTVYQLLTLLLIWTLLPIWLFYLIVPGFYRTSATGVACQHRTLTPQDTLSCPTLRLACVLMLRPISWTCLISGLLSFEHPSVLLFASLTFLNKS